jgi:hypothetical protein
LHQTLRMAPTCYHALHQFPAAVAHEMNFFYDEGLRTESGERGYELLDHGLCPFGQEHLGMWQAQQENNIHVVLDVKPQSVFYSRKHSGADLYIVAGWRNQQTTVWAARPEVTSLAELRGRTVGIIDFSGISHNALRTRLRAAGVDPDTEVNWMRGVSRPHNIDYLRAGTVDATLFQAHQIPALQDEGFNILVSPSRDEFPGGRAERVVAATGDLIENRPEELAAFLRGLLRSYWFIRNQPANFRYLQQMERRRRLDHPSLSEKRRVTFTSPEVASGMPFPIDGLATGFHWALQDALDNGELDELPTEDEVDQVCRFELVKSAYADLLSRPEAQEDLTQARAAFDRLGF